MYRDARKLLCAMIEAIASSPFAASAHAFKPFTQSMLFFTMPFAFVMFDI